MTLTKDTSYHNFQNKGNKNIFTELLTMEKSIIFKTAGQLYNFVDETKVISNYNIKLRIIL